MKVKECLVRKAVVAVGVAALAAGAFAGGGWELLPIYGGGRILDVFFTRNPKVVYAVSDVGGPCRTDDGGLSWRPLHAGYPYAWRLRQMNKAYTLNVDPRDENSVIAGCGDDAKHSGGILVTRDGGKTWKETAVANFRANAAFRKTTGRTVARNPLTGTRRRATSRYGPVRVGPPEAKSGGPFAVAMTVSVAAMAAPAPAPFRAGERIGFFGDSISEIGSQAFYNLYPSRHELSARADALHGRLAAVRPVSWRLSLTRVTE